MGTLLGSSRSELASKPDTLSLDLQTFRAFQNQDQVVKTWNRDILLLMKKSDRDKSGPLRIGVELPSAVTSIVGEGGAGLQVSGYQRISFAGRSQWSDVTSVSSVRQSKFPSLTMEQINRFTVEGTIGSKVSVKVDQDSKRTTDLANRIQIRYKGDEDDILQTVEAGNTTLSLPNTQYVGYSQSIQGLFGLKATAQVGPVGLTMITSQEKGNTVRNRFTAGATEQLVTFRDYDYAHNRFFDLGVIGDSTYVHPDQGDTIIDFALFQGVGNTSSYTPQPGVIIIKNDTAVVNSLRPDSLPEQRSIQDFKQLTTPDYYVLRQGRGIGAFLFFPVDRTDLGSSYLAYYMKVRKADGSYREFGSMAGTSYVLQILRTTNPLPSDPFWRAEWKNVYDLRVRNIQYIDLDLDIFKGEPGTENLASNLNNQSGVPYLRLLGLDSVTTDGAPSPDNKIDEIRLDLANGLLIFPNRTPFANRELAVDVDTIYKTSNSVDLQNASKYYFALKTRSRSTSFNLGAVNIMTESEVVTLNGRRLLRGSDYDIDYDLGRLTFKGDNIINEATQPNAQVTIDYEYAPFLSVDKRTLFGIRGEYAPSQDFHTGTTFLYKGSKSTDRPAQLGSEPFRDMVLDYDVYWKSDARFLTKLADALPVVKTESPSSFTFAAEIARSMPNPNTKGNVLIDDFESAKRSYSLGVLRESWSIASPPFDALTFKARPKRGLYDPGLIWFNPYTQFDQRDIYNRNLGNQTQNSTRMHVLVLEFRPDRSVTKDSVGGPWAGIMHGLSKGSWDQSKAEYIELRMAVYGRKPGQSLGRLHIDLGKISEDVNLNGELDTEDKNNNGVLESDEDVGLDGLPDSLEVGPHGEKYNKDSLPDPAGDNWSYDSQHNQNDYSHINGTQGDSLDGYRGGVPSTEDIGGESSKDYVNSYYSYTLDLADPDKTILVEGSEKTIGGDKDPTGYSTQLTWKTYRIPLWDPSVAGFARVWNRSLADSATNAPTSNNIQFARIWMDGTSDTTRVYIAGLDLVENAWIPSTDTAKAVSDSLPGPTSFQGSFRVAVKNTEENADYLADLPPGVSVYTDPTTGVRDKEQSLTMVYDKFRPGDAGVARLATPSAEDFTGYQFLRMLVHGDRTGDTLTQLYFRFGQDTLNYYYFRNAVRPGWIGNDVYVDFDRLTILKALAVPDSLGRINVFDTTSHLGVKGQPSLSRVVYMQIGVVRDGSPTDLPASGEIWCDQLQLEGVRKDVGTAGRIKVTTQMADLLGFTASVDAQNYAFRTLNDGRTGSVLNSSSQLREAASGNVMLNKFFPATWGLSLPVSITFGQNVSTPKLLPGSDVVLDAALQAEQRTTTIADGVATSIKWTPPTKNWLLNNTLGGLSGTFSVNRQRSWSPTQPYFRSEGYAAGASYALRFPRRLTFPPLYWTRFLLWPKRLYSTPFSLLPNDFSASGNVNRTSTISVNSQQLVTPSYNRFFDGSSRVSLAPIPSVTMSYSMTTHRDLSNPDQVNVTFDPSRFKLGREQRYTQRFTADYKPSLFAFATHVFSYSADFNDQIDNVYFNHNWQGSRSWSGNGTFDLAKFWQFLGYQQPKQTQRPQTTQIQKSGKAGGIGEPRKVDPKFIGPMPPEQEQTSKTKKSGKNKDEMDPHLAGAPPTDQGETKEASQKFDANVFGPPTPDTTKKGQQPGGGEGGFGPVAAWRGFLSGANWITTPIGPMSVTYQHAEGNSQTTLQRPVWKFLFGFIKDPGADQATTNTTTGGVAALTKSDNLGIKNNLRFGNLLTFGNSYGLGTSSRNQSGSETRAKSVSFPVLSTSLDRLERYRPFSWVFTSASARFGYSVKTDSSWGLGGASVTKSSGFSPLVNLSGTIRKTIRFGFNLENNTTKTSSEQTGIAPTERSSHSWRVNVDYQFSSPHGIPLPFLRGLRLKSQMTVSVVVNGKTSTGFSTDPTSHLRTSLGESSEFTVTPQGNYSFSSRVKGGFTAQWSDLSDNQAGSGRRKSHIRSLGIWAEFSF